MSKHEALGLDLEFFRCAQHGQQLDGESPLQA